MKRRTKWNKNSLLVEYRKHYCYIRNSLIAHILGLILGIPIMQVTYTSIKKEFYDTKIISASDMKETEKNIEKHKEQSNSFIDHFLWSIALFLIKVTTSTPFNIKC